MIVPLVWVIATGAAYALMLWINRRWAHVIEPRLHSIWFMAFWVIVCVAIPFTAGILAAWAVSR